MSEPMPLADKVFYLISGAFLVVFGTGLWLVFVEHDLSTGVPLSGLGVIGMGTSLWEKPRTPTPDTARQGRYTALNAVLAVCILAAVGYDIYDRRTHPAMTPSIVKGWGHEGGCYQVLDGPQLVKWNDKYDIGIMCGIDDSSVDKFKDKRISISQLFTILPEDIPIYTPLSKTMADGITQIQRGIRTQFGLPANAVIPVSVWTATVLLPKHFDASQITCLDDVPRDGGILLNHINQPMDENTN
jgi:hypothetical protein